MEAWNLSVCISYSISVKYPNLNIKTINEALLFSLPQFAHAILICPLPLQLLYLSLGTLSRKCLVCFNHSASPPCNHVFRLVVVQHSWFDPWLESPARHWSCLSIDMIGFPFILFYKSWFIHLSCLQVSRLLLVSVVSFCCFDKFSSVRIFLGFFFVFVFLIVGHFKAVLDFIVLHILYYCNMILQRKGFPSA